MDTDSKEIAKLVESGEYYRQSHEWYETLYIGPISERTFFLVIAVLAGCVAVIGFFALMAFLPLTDHPGIFLGTTHIDDHVPQAIPLKENGKNTNQALLDFFISTYVLARESYTAESYPSNYNFIRAQSDTPTFNSYYGVYSRANPRSPAAILGNRGKRMVEIHGVSIDTKSEPKTATVQFSTEITGFEDSAKTNWTATLQFYYSDLVVTKLIDPQTGEETLQTQDPQFQVVNYALTQVH